MLLSSIFSDTGGPNPLGHRSVSSYESLFVFWIIAIRRVLSKVIELYTPKKRTKDTLFMK